MSPGAFATALRARGFQLKGDRIIDVSCGTGRWWKVATDEQGHIDRARSLRKAVQGRNAQIARRNAASFA
jgi:hypothetical protein